MMLEEARNLTQYRRYKTDDESRKTSSSIDQIKTEASIARLYDAYEQSQPRTPPKLLRAKHKRYLESSLEKLSTGYECLDSSRPWLVYWILNAASVLDVQFHQQLLSRTVDFLVKCRSKEGGFAGGPGQYPHLATTYAAVNALCIIGTTEALEAIDRDSLKRFFRSVREPNGAFRMHVGGELDVRGAYCAISSAKLANFSAADRQTLFEGTAKWIAECQTYEGGFGGTPFLEAHGGYSFCAAATLMLIGGEELCDLQALLRWTVNRQMAYEGGFQGRTNKLVDGCYSFWQGSLVPIVQALIARKDSNPDVMRTSLFNRTALQEYIIICCQMPNGGLIDKPGKPADLYHTCYTLSGLSISQHCEADSDGPVVFGDKDNELLPTHPVHNVPPEAANKAYQYFERVELAMGQNGHCCNFLHKPETRVSEEDDAMESTSSASGCTSSRTSEDRSMEA